MRKGYIKQSVCMSIIVVVVVGTRSRILGICVYYKHNQSVDIGEKLVCTCFKLLKRLTSATNHAFSVQHACDCTCSSSVLERVVKS